MRAPSATVALPVALATTLAVAPSHAQSDADRVIEVPQTDDYADTDPSALTDFRPALDPYGNWVDDPSYGLVWTPNAEQVGTGFQPYETSGSWDYADGDPVWVSNYAWGWVCFHYGRWAWSGGRWVWIPGREYAGAWVSWRLGDDAFRVRRLGSDGPDLGLGQRGRDAARVRDARAVDVLGVRGLLPAERRLPRRHGEHRRVRGRAQPSLCSGAALGESGRRAARTGSGDTRPRRDAPGPAGPRRPRDEGAPARTPVDQGAAPRSHSGPARHVVRAWRRVRPDRCREASARRAAGATRGRR